ncbi:MAG: ABC transporter substrate-binding protein [bacterium]|nr:ABC transporter substrate-binding protein [bacterium]
MKKRRNVVLTAGLLASLLLAGCGGSGAAGTEGVDSSVSQNADGSKSTVSEGGLDTTYYIKFVDDEPDTTDVHCTTDYYTVGMNIFDRLVEVKPNEDGTSELVPSLAESVAVSSDGLTYTFQLKEGIQYSNGAALTSDDVLYTFTRLLTYDKSKNSDFVDQILGAEELMEGTADTLAGFEVIDDYNFTVTLKEPYAAFLACLSTPSVSIYDRETTEEAGADFGLVPEKTVGTGPFVFEEWTLGSQIVLSKNENYWDGAPDLDGIVIKFVPDAETQRMMYESGELDILDLDNAASQISYFLDNPDYSEQIHSGPRVGVYYYSFNQNIEPFSDVRVRKALQMAIDRQAILDALYSGKGQLENGIFPHGLIGYNAELPQIEYNPEKAKELLAEAGYPDGFSMEIAETTDADATTVQRDEILQAMLGEIGVTVDIKQYDSASFYDIRATGELPMYSSNWSADFNDPDNFIYTFFGTEENSKKRSFNYYNEDVIARVAKARSIVDEDERIKEYQELEKIAIQDDAAWIPLFSKEHLFIVNPRVQNFTVSWNGWSGNYYKNMSIAK